MKTRAILFAAALALLLATPASAAPRYWGVAAQFWGRAPERCSSITYRSEVKPEDLGEATLTYPGYFGPCVFAVEPMWSKAQTCLETVHEYGHLLGLHHSHNPRSVMYPDAPLDPRAVPACDRLVRP